MAKIRREFLDNCNTNDKYLYYFLNEKSNDSDWIYCWKNNNKVQLIHISKNTTTPLNITAMIWSRHIAFLFYLYPLNVFICSTNWPKSAQCVGKKKVEILYINYTWLPNPELSGGMCWWICLSTYFLFVAFDIINRILKGLLFSRKFPFRLENCLRLDGRGLF